MKTRDELAEMFAEAFVLSSTGGYSAHADVIVKQAFACADEFVVERERRAVASSADAAVGAAPTGYCADERGGFLCTQTEGHAHDHVAKDIVGREVSRWSRAPLTDAPAPEAKKPHDPDAGCAECEHLQSETERDYARCAPAGVERLAFRSLPVVAPSSCPKRAPAETVAPALRFDAEGNLLDAHGMIALHGTVGYDGDVDDRVAIVSFLATSRAHAERLVAAMLKAGRETK